MYVHEFDVCRLDVSCERAESEYLSDALFLKGKTDEGATVYIRLAVSDKSLINIVNIGSLIEEKKDA